MEMQHVIILGFQYPLSSNGSIVAIGAPENASNGTDAGHVRIYKNISGTWTQLGSDIDGESAGDYSGVAVSLSSDGSTVAIGAMLNGGNGADAGHVRVYTIGTANVSEISINKIMQYILILLRALFLLRPKHHF